LAARAQCIWALEVFGHIAKDKGNEISSYKADEKRMQQAMTWESAIDQDGH
jgi:hypothetical protein